MRFLLATRNEGKVREFRILLASLPASLISLAQWDDLPDVKETGTTFAENARLKSRTYFRLTGLPTLADDSGLVVDALGGAPGIRSARFGKTDSERIERLLAQLSRAEREKRSGARKAHFVCALCLSGPDGELEVEGRVDGLITRIPRGGRGFGYDPVFLYPPLGRTFAELTAAEKNRVSHRAAACRKLVQALARLGPQWAGGS